MEHNSISKLMVEISFAAVNYGLRNDMKNLLSALPFYIDNSNLLIRSEAILLFGLGYYKSSLIHISRLDDDDCIQFKKLINSLIKE